MYCVCIGNWFVLIWYSVSGVEVGFYNYFWDFWVYVLGFFVSVDFVFRKAV